MKKAKKIIAAFLIIVVIALLIPFRIQYKDGGSVQYKAALYSVWKMHAVYPGANENEIVYLKGTRIRILFWEVYDGTYTESEK